MIDEERAKVGKFLDEMTDLDHPCRDTCSGWRQGFLKGRESMRADRDEQCQLYKNKQDQIFRFTAKLEAERKRSSMLIELVATLMRDNRGVNFLAAKQAIAEYESQKQMSERKQN